MSRVQYNPISTLKKGRYNWNIKVRVLRKWPIGTTESEDKLMGFNLLLLDDKDFRLHAFVANELAPTYANVFKEGEIYSICNFTVKEYIEKDKNVPIEADQQIILTTYTRVNLLDNIGSTISNNAFEFYNIANLEKLANQDKYLTNVIGVVEQLQPIRRYVSRDGKNQVHLNFVLTDGRSRVNAILWKQYAEDFVRGLTGDLEEPLIVIISSAKVSYHSGVLQVSTWFNNSSVYLNYDHHTVIAMRKKLTEPFIASYELSSQTIVEDKMFTVTELLKLSEKYIDKKIISELTIKKFKSNSNWITYECTSCQEEVQLKNEVFTCSTCNRQVLCPDMKFRLAAICYDDTGALACVFKDRDIQRLLNKSAYKLQQEFKSESFPPPIKALQNIQVTVLLHISEENVKNKSNVFNCYELAIGHGSSDLQGRKEMEEPMSVSQIASANDDATTSSYEGVHLTNLNILTPATKNISSGRRVNKFPTFKLLSQDSD